MKITGQDPSKFHIVQVILTIKPVTRLSCAFYNGQHHDISSSPEHVNLSFVARLLRTFQTLVWLQFLGENICNI